MRKILITNDDGINADGIRRLAQCAVNFGEVWVVAPARQCSAMSHRITLREPMLLTKYDFPVNGIRAYALDGTPADCVRFALSHTDMGMPDVVMSGINDGFNIGSDIQYSATVGSALEAASVGVRAIAFSEGRLGCRDITEKYLYAMMEELIDKNPGDNAIWNVNFPECPLSEYKGILYDRTVARNSFFTARYIADEQADGSYIIREAGEHNEDAAPGTDFRALLDGYISVGTVSNLQ